MIDVDTAKDRVTSALAELVNHEGSPYRAAAVFVSYLGPDGDTHISHGQCMQRLDLGSAVDMVRMVEALRTAATELEQIIAQRQLPRFVVPLPRGGN